MAPRKIAEGVVVLDLDGILGLGDAAKELFDRHSVERNGQKVNLGEYFAEKSGEIGDAFMQGGDYRGEKAYAGQTLEVVMKDALQAGARITEKEIAEIGRSSRLVPGARRLVEAAKKTFGEKNVFIVTTTYRPAALEVARRVGVRPENLYATGLVVENGIVKAMKGQAMGGANKAWAVTEISQRTRIPVSRFVAVGDSITDIDMMERVRASGGLAIAFDAAPELLGKKPNVVVAARSVRPVGKAIRKFGAKGMGPVDRYVKANEFFHRIIPTFMRIARRPALFRGSVQGAEEARMRRASETARRKLRGQKIAKLRY